METATFKRRQPPSRFNRPKSTGWLSASNDWATLKTNFASTITFPAYSNEEVLTQTTYDSYPNSSLCSLDSKENSVKGQVTYQKAKLLTGSGYRETYFFYDNKYRVIQSVIRRVDCLGNILTNLINQTTTNTYDFTGKVIASSETYSGAVNQSIDKMFSYDHAGRLEKAEQQLVGDSHNGKVVLAQNDYNELGQLMLKKLHNASDTSYVQDIDYLYDVRGWLKSINNMSDTTSHKLYAQNLTYFNNGNINSSVWKNTILTNKGWISPSNQQQYSFTYDGLNRMTAATYSEIDITNQAVSAKANFFNENPSYDLNGNITAMVREGNTSSTDFVKGTIDNLEYEYATYSNQLNKVTDAISSNLGHDKHFKNGSTATYAYDNNGNATFIPNKNLNIEYNYLNLPTSIGSISYLYDASGNKLKKTYNGVVSYYQGSVLNIDGKPIVLTGEGRAIYDNNMWTYEYDLKDHLGNTRISFVADSVKVKPLQYKDYYPFGLEMAQNYNNKPDATKFRYNGKELQDEGGLDWYDYGARFYDPAIGRWHTPEPYAELVPSISVYAYCYDNPINYTEPDGRWPGFRIFGVPVYDVHARIIRKALNPYIGHGLTKEQLDQIIEGGAYIDKYFQDPKYSYMHSMRNGLTNQSVTSAIAARDEWVNNNINEFKASGGKGYKNLGYAIHAMSDQYAPTHSFKSWSGVGPFFRYGIPHLLGELNLFRSHGPGFNLSVKMVQSTYEKATQPEQNSSSTTPAPVSPRPVDPPIDPITPIPWTPTPAPAPSPMPMPQPQPQPPVPLPPLN